MKRRILVVSDRAEDVDGIATRLQDSRADFHVCSPDEALRSLHGDDDNFDAAIVHRVHASPPADQPERRAPRSDRRADPAVTFIGDIQPHSSQTDIYLLTAARAEAQALLRSEAVSAGRSLSASEIADVVTRRYDRQAVSRDPADLERLLHMAADVRSTLDLNAVMDNACRLGYELLPIAHSSVMLFSSELNSATVTAEYPYTERHHRQVALADIPAARRLVETAQLLETEAGDRRSWGDSLPAVSLSSGLLLAAPLVVRSTVLGCLLVAPTVSGPLAEKHRKTIEGIAALLALAIQNARLHRDSVVATEHLETLRRTLGLDKPLERRALLQRIIGDAVKIVGATGGGIYAFDETTRTLSVVAEFSRPDHIGRTIQVGHGMAGYLVQRALERRLKPELPELNALAVCDYDASELRAVEAYPDHAFGSVLELLLKWDDRIVGVLYVDDGAGREFSADDQQALWTNARQASVALADITVPTGGTRLTGRRWTEIFDVGVTEFDQRLTDVASHAAHMLNAESAGVFLVRETGSLDLEASYGHTDEGFTKGLRLAIRSDGGLTGYIAWTGQPFRAHGEALTKHPAVRNSKPKHLKSGQCCSLVALPLFVTGPGERTLKGLLRLENKLSADGMPSPDIGFTADDQAALEAFGNMVTVTLTNADLVAELREKEAVSERRRELLAAVNQATDRLRMARDLTDLHEGLVREAILLVGGSAACLYTNHPRVRQVEVLTSAGLGQGYAVGTLEPYDGESPAAHVARDGEAISVLRSGYTPAVEFGERSFKTLIAVPLRRGHGAVDGVLVVGGNSSHHRYAELESQVLEQLATHAAGLIQVAALRKWQQRALEKVDALERIRRYIRTSNSDEKALAAFLTGITAGYGFGFNRAAVYLIDESGRYLDGRLGIGDFIEAKARHAWNQRDELSDVDRYLHYLERNGHYRTELDARTRVERWRLSRFASSAPFADASAHGSTLVDTEEGLAELPEELLSSLDGAGEHRVRPIVVTALRACGEVLGFMVADNLFSQHPVPNDELGEITRLADLLAVTLFRLRSGSQAANAAADGPSTAGSDDAPVSPRSQAVKAHMVSGARQLLNASSAVLWEHDPDTNTWRLEEWVGVGRQHWDAFKSHGPEPGYTTERVLDEGWLPVPNLDDVDNTPFVTAQTRSLLRQIGVKSFQAVALKHGTDVLGVLYLNYERSRGFADADREEAFQCAEGAARLLQDARHRERMARAELQLEASLAVAAAGVLWTNWDHSVRSTAFLLEDKLERLDAAAAAGRLNSWIDEARPLVKRISVAPDYKGLLQLCDTDVCAALDTAVRQERLRLASDSVTVSVTRPDEPLIVRANPSLLASAFHHFVKNSLEALEKRSSGPAGGAIEIVVSRQDHRARIEFTDNGIGIDRAVQQEAFERPIDSQRAAGSGIGLLTARTTLMCYRGDAELLYSSDAGTRIAAWIPLKAAALPGLER